MKKLLGFIVALGLMFGIAGQALAAFSVNDLMMVVYSEGDVEVAINLGDVTTISSLGANATLGTISLSDYASGTTWDDLHAGLFASDGEDLSNYYFATTQNAAPGFTSSVETSFTAITGQLYTLYNTLDTDDDGRATLSVTDRRSYDYKMNSNSRVPGFYCGVNSKNAKYGEADLEDLLEDGYVDLYLYNYVYVEDTDTFELVTGSGGSLYAAIIRINADGSIVANPSAVPIPASILLFGSGLLGLFGIRRKNGK